MMTAKTLRDQSRHLMADVEAKYVIRNRMVPGGFRLHFDSDEDRRHFDATMTAVERLQADARRLEWLERQR
jgi:hypothetical protein